MSFLKGTINDVLTLEADDTNTLTLYIDVELAVHTNMNSHTDLVQPKMSPTLSFYAMYQKSFIYRRNRTNS